MDFKTKKFAEWNKLCEAIENNKEFLENRYKGMGKVFISDLIDEMETNLFLKDIVTKTRIDTLRQVLPEKQLQQNEWAFDCGFNDCRKRIEAKAKKIWGININE